MEGKKLLIILVALYVLFPSFIFAETIILKSGQEIEGKITEKNDKYIKIELEGITIPYYLDQIESIDGKKLASTSPAKETNSKGKLTAEEAYNKGQDYLNKKMYDEAIAEFTKAIELRPDMAGLVYSRGLAYYQKGDWDQAISDCTKAIETIPNYVKNPFYANFFYVRGLAYDKKNNWDQAISDYTRVIEINPKYKRIYYCRAVLYNNKSNYDQAIRDYTKAIEINPNDGDAYVERAGIYCFIKNDYDKAWADVHKAEALGVGNRLTPKFYEMLKKSSGREK